VPLAIFESSIRPLEGTALVKQLAIREFAIVEDVFFCAVRGIL
jgi:hypothetical protein